MATENTSLPQSVREGIRKRLIQIGLLLLFEAALLFLTAGRIDWLWAWVYLLLYLAGVSVNAYFMFRYSPETIARRASAEGMKSWDKVVSGLGAAMGLIQMVVAGLDARYVWSGEQTLVVHGTGIVLFVLGFGLFGWAMITNAYFATVVRVQTDQGHRVCTTGPYRYVRHPGYVGAILQSFGMSLLFGSVWSLFPASLVALFIIIRTALEDRTLRIELPGYVEYTQHTHYRLLPGVW